MRIKIGIIGLGHLGKIHLKCIQSLPDEFELVGIYDVDASVAAKVSEAFNVKSFESVESLLASVEAVDIVSITSSHFELAAKALQLDRHVFIEKPVTATSVEGEQLLDLQAKCGKVVQVGHVERFNPAYLAIKDLQIKPLFIESHRLAEFNLRGTDVSVVLDLMIHDLDLILHLVKSPVVDVHATGVCVVSPTPDISNARIEFENGCVANVTASRLSLKRMRKMRVFQPDAYLSLDFLEKQTQVIRMYDAEGAPEDDQSFLIDTGKGPKRISIKVPDVLEVNAISEELKAFAVAVNTNTPPLVTLKAGVEAVRLAHVINDQIMSINELVKPEIR